MHLLKHIFYYVGLIQKNFSEKKPEKTLKEKKNKQNKTKQNKTKNNYAKYLFVILFTVTENVTYV